MENDMGQEQFTTKDLIGLGQSLGEVKSDVRAIHGKLDAFIDEVRGKTDRLHTRVNELEEEHQKAKGAAFVLGAIAGMVTQGAVLLINLFR